MKTKLLFIVSVSINKRYRLPNPIYYQAIKFILETNISSLLDHSACHRLRHAFHLITDTDVAVIIQSRTSIKAHPSRFSPIHCSTPPPWACSLSRPIPQMMS